MNSQAQDKTMELDCFTIILGALEWSAYVSALFPISVKNLASRFVPGNSNNHPMLWSENSSYLTS